MLGLVRLVTRVLEMALLLPLAVAKTIVDAVALNPRLGPIRYFTLAALAYGVFAVVLVYVVAPARGFIGHLYMGEKIRYDAELNGMGSPISPESLEGAVRYVAEATGVRS